MPDEIPLDNTEKALLRLQYEVESLGKSLHKLNDYVMATNGPVDLRFERNEKTVNARLDGIETKLEKLGSRLEEKSRFPWAIVLTFAGLFLSVTTGIGSFAMSNLKGDIDRHERDISSVQLNYMTRAEIDVRAQRVYRDLDGINKRLDNLEKKRP